MSPLLAFVTISRRSSTHRAYCRSANAGPAAGVIAGAELARRTRRRHVITFDMGGTSTDISVIVEGRLLETTQGQIAGQDIGTPMLRVRTLGAGGGTIAWIGKDGLLKVGPRSAGGDPGPACYGKGGVEPTVTDADLVLGLVPADHFLGGEIALDRAAHQLDPARVELVAQADDAVALVGDDVLVRNHAFCRTWTARLATRSLFFSP